MTEYTNNVPLTQLKEIVSMVMYAAEADTLEQVLQRIANASRGLIGAKYAALGVPDGRGGLRYFMVSGISDDEIEEIPHPPIGKGLIGAIMNERQSLRVARIQDDPRSSGFPEGHPPMASMLGVPIMVGEQLFGMLYLTDREDGHMFSLSDQWLVETLAGYAALAIAGTQLREQQSRLALLEERQRIGMELHDGVIQSLYAIGMYLDLMRSTGEWKPDNVKQAIDGLNEVIEDIRRYIMNLKSTPYRDKTIREAMHEIVAHLYVPKSLDIVVEAPDHYPPFTEDDFESICFIAREALSNAVRHADATQVMIYCRQYDNHLQMSIRDNGKGFDPNAVEHQDGMGLRNIRQRAALHHGQAHLESTPGEGTTLTITIPVKERINYVTPTV